MLLAEPSPSVLGTRLHSLLGQLDNVRQLAPSNLYYFLRNTSPQIPDSFYGPLDSLLQTEPPFLSLTEAELEVLRQENSVDSQNLNNLEEF